MYIPDDALPEVTRHPIHVKHPKLPPQNEIHGSFRGKGTDSAENALFHYKEALSHLAMSKWYLEQEAGHGTD